MGLASTLSTALTGLTAAETTLDVVGNNVANANTVGFKESEAIFATQFVLTQSLGSGPTASTGGTNPRQLGLGTKVAAIAPNFTQGTVEISASPSDLAIQGDGFFIVQGQSGEQLYSRNGIFSTNANNELVTVNGQRLLGFGVDDNFQLQPTVLVPLTIPLGARAVSQVTQNVFFQGSLRPDGDVADTAAIIQSGVLGDSSFTYPITDFGDTPVVVTGPTTAPSGVVNGAGSLEAGTFAYRVVFIDSQGNESPASPASADIVAAANDAIDVTIPTDAGAPPANYVGRRVYRSLNGGDFYEVAQINDLVTLTFNDTASQASIEPPSLGATILDADPQPSGTRSHNYRITYSSSLGNVPESRPSPILGGGPVSVVGNDRIKLTNLPGLADVPPPYDRINIYRSLDGNDTEFHLVSTLTPVAGSTEYIDGKTDAFLQGQPELDFDGPPIQASTTLLLDVIRYDGGDTYEPLFAEEGVLRFTGGKGGRALGEKEFQVTATSTVQDLIDFMEEALGIQENTDPTNPIPPSLTDTGTIDPGGTVTVDGRIQLVSNNGLSNAVDISLSSFQFTGNSGTVSNVNLPFGETQAARGESAVTDFVAYDSLGIPVQVRVTVVQESRTDTTTTYRWFADSPDNQPATGVNIAVGTGLIVFDGEGKVIDVTNSTVAIDRRLVASASPLEFDLHFEELSGLSVPTSEIAAARQDGFPPGTLSSFLIGEDGTIRGVFSNGVTRDLGQIRLARFANPIGLQQKGENLFSAGVNSGLPILGNPGQQGIGRIVAGAVELSNTDIGGNLIDLILASTQYRSNARVIDAAQRLLDELLNLRR
jgi:flagellar hook protein FlgE